MAITQSKRPVTIVTGGRRWCSAHTEYVTQCAPRDTRQWDVANPLAFFKQCKPTKYQQESRSNKVLGFRNHGVHRGGQAEDPESGEGNKHLWEFVS